MMLSRVANSIYWLERYLERADNTARFIQVNKSVSLDFPKNKSLWSSLIQATANEEIYKENYSNYSSENVIYFLTFDKTNPNSIINCLIQARENARIIREMITADIWEIINAMYYFIKSKADSKDVLVEPGILFSRLKSMRMNYMGLVNNCITVGEGHHFAMLGRFIERADMTSRILDVKYFTILPEYTNIGSAIDNIQWTALLDSIDGQEMYIRKMGTTRPEKILKFVILAHDFPRSLLYSLKKAQKALHEMSGTTIGLYKTKQEKIIGRLNAQVAFSSVDEIIEYGVHDFLDSIQSALREFSAELDRSYFNIDHFDEKSKQQSSQ